MARTIVYPRAVIDSPFAEIFRSKRRRSGGPVTAEASTETAFDGYKDKIAKYVPAEVLAFFAPIAGTMSDRPGLVFAAALAGLLATPAYFWRTAQGLPEKERPLPHFYFLAATSFVIWAVATTRLGSIIGLDQTAASFVLATAVFLVPLLDEVVVLVLKARTKNVVVAPGAPKSPSIKRSDEI